MEGRREHLLSALVGLVVLEIRLSFLDFVNDDVVSFFLSFVFLLLLLHLVHLYVSYSTCLVCVCHILGFVIMVLHFATTFTIAMTLC